MKAPYFTAYETKNAQTVSHKQRHRPVFQLFVDFNFAIVVTSTLILGYLLRLHNKDSGDLKVSEHIADKVMPRLMYASLFFVKFFIFTAWYRCVDQGNIPQLTKQLFWMRFIYDLFIYGFTVLLVLDVTVNDYVAYVYMGVMFVKEIYIYFACVRRAD